MSQQPRTVHSRVTETRPPVSAAGEYFGNGDPDRGAGGKASVRLGLARVPHPADMVAFIRSQVYKPEYPAVRTTKAGQAA
jgi:hypothetical protein